MSQPVTPEPTMAGVVATRSWSQVASQSNPTAPTVIPIMETNWDIEWRCQILANGRPMTEDQTQGIEKLAIDTVKTGIDGSGGTTIIFRDGVHNKTKSRAPPTGGKRRGRGGRRNADTVMIKDPRGDHFTVEWRHPKKQQWYTFHYYVKERADGIFERNTDRGIGDNPDMYTDGTDEPHSKDVTPTRINRIFG